MICTTTGPTGLALLRLFRRCPRAPLRSRLRHGLLIAAAALMLCAPHAARAWDATGHQMVAAIAEKLLAGTPALDKARGILGPNTTLRDAAVWPDCARGVLKDATHDFEYDTRGVKYPECAPFETPAEKVVMQDYVKINFTNCVVVKGAEDCHKQYHYTDVATQRENYRELFAPGGKRLAGTSEQDVVHAIRAAVAKLKDQPVPAPFTSSFASKREALMLLTHLVGDVHQPLHVGAVYLSAGGAVIDPDLAVPPAARENDTIGGNALVIRGENLHHRWDAVTTTMAADAEADARATPATTGPLDDWPSQWATETLTAAKWAYSDLHYTRRGDDGSGARNLYYWGTSLPDGYNTQMEAVKKKQLGLAAARLAQVLGEVLK